MAASGGDGGNRTPVHCCDSAPSTGVACEAFYSAPTVVTGTSVDKPSLSVSPAVPQDTTPQQAPSMTPESGARAHPA